MPFYLIIKCRCGHRGELHFQEWKEGQAMLRRVRCTACGATGLENMTLERATFLSRERKRAGRDGRNR